MVNRIFLIVAVVLTVILSGLFAGAETGIYQISRLRLRLGIEKKRLSFVILGKAMRDSSALLLSMLLGNNLTHYIATSIVTLLLLSRIEAEHAAELFATVITAPILFVFAELIPKSIFFYRSDVLMPALGPVLFAFHKAFTFCGAVPALKFASRLFARLAGLHGHYKTAITAVRAPHISVIFQETREEDILSPVQADIINRIVSISDVRISSVMTPLSKVRTVDVNSDGPAMLKTLKKYAFTRLPVYEHRPENIIGFINIYEP